MTKGHKDYFIEVENVSKTYGDLVALSPVSLHIGKGERVALLGPSGSGKTTLLHLIGGVLTPDSGLVVLGGKKILDLGPGKEIASLIGIMYQQLDLITSSTVAHNVLVGRLGYWSFWRTVGSLIFRMERNLALGALERVGLRDRIEERVNNLSGGEQQRVAIARLIVQDPQIVIADEPVASLDPVRANDILSLLIKMTKQSQKTLICSVHTEYLARKYFSRAIGIKDGTMIFDLDIANLTNDRINSLYEMEDS